MSSKQRIVGLDLMRIFLALLIFMFHSQLHFKCNYHYFNEFISKGAIAMTGFMLLSGYVLYITYSSRDFTTIKEIKMFYLKRLITILPLYYSIALIHVLCSLIFGRTSYIETIVLFPVEFLGIQSTFFSLFSYSHNGGTWFISCILLCYAIYPYIQIILTNISRTWQKVILFLSCGILLYAPLVQIFFNLDKITIYANPFYRLLEFLIGVTIAHIIQKETKHRTWDFLINPIILFFTIIIFLISVSIVSFYYPPNNFMLYNWLVLPCFIIIILNLVSFKFNYLNNSKTIAYLSSISFTFFLCQVLPLWELSSIVCKYLNKDSNFFRISISFSICLLGAIIIHEIIEKPSSQYLRK